MTAFNWKFDESHSEIGFVVKHMMFAKVRGNFEEWSGTLQFDPEDSSKNLVQATVKTASINTGNGQRDEHLQSGDFFNVEGYPEMKFESTGWTKNGGGYDVAGNLTIRDTTRPITLSVENNGTGVDPWGNTRVGFSVSATINRKDFGLSWNQALEAGGVLVGEDVKLDIEVQAIQAEKVDAAAA